MTVAVPLVLAAIIRLYPNPRTDRAIRGTFATLLVASEFVWLRLLYQAGWLWVGNVLPMQLCDWAAIAAVITLIRPAQASYELAYFWAFGGTLQALLTPDLAVDFSDMRFVIFFVFHSGVIAAVLYLTLGTRLRPIPASIPRVILWTLGYAAAALITNWLFGTNFGFLAAKPPIVSLLSYLGPWPFYIFELVPVAFLLILILYCPFFLADRLKQRRS